MTLATAYRAFRFPAEVIPQAVWLYHRFSLHLGDVELILSARDVMASYETIRDWDPHFGRLVAKAPTRLRPGPGRIRGKLHYRWRAVDPDDHMLDLLVQSRRHAIAQRSPSVKSAKRSFRKLLRGLQHTPSVIVTDMLRSYTVANRGILPGVEHQLSRSHNNRAEASHQPTRRRERQMQRFNQLATRNASRPLTAGSTTTSGSATMQHTSPWLRLLGQDRSRSQ